MEVILTIFVGFFQLLGRVLFDYWGWLIVVALLGFAIWQNTRKKRWVGDTEFSLLMIEVPKDNDRQALAAEQMFASLHGILRPKQELIKEGALQEHISLEIASVNNQIRFYVRTPKHLKNFVEGQIYAQYPSVNIEEVAEDYAKQGVEGENVYGAELTLSNNDVIPIKTFKSFEVDPLAGITAVLAKLEEKGEQGWIQILARPIDDSWHSKGESYISNIRDGKSTGGDIGNNLFEWIRGLFSALWAPPTSSGSGGAAPKPELSEQAKAHLQAISDKINKLGWQVKIRLVHIGPDKALGRLRIQSLVGAFKQFNDTNNGFKVKNYIDGEDALKTYQARLFDKGGFTLNIEELASLYHLPHTNVETPNMVWASSKTAEPPTNLPSVETTPADQLSPIGTTNFRGNNTQFGLKRSDRGRHAYIVGQTGTGKSYLMTLLMLSDIYNGQGFAVIDPHGDLATKILPFIPEHRLQDVVYFNPADTNFPIAFNPLEVTDPAMKGHIASEVVGVLERMFGYSWGPRLEYILRYTLLALLDYPHATMLGITRMLTDKAFRQKIIKQIQDPVVKNFWVTEFASWNEKFASEAISPVLNKVGAFTANPLIRNIIGQPKSAMNIRELMDQGKILIVNLSRGQVGEDNAATLGALMVTKIQLAAMSRASQDMELRVPFYLYVDEFQNFATNSFAVILSEARKYGLNLTVANQYVSQLTPEVRDAVFGNVGTMMVFRIGADDGAYVAKYFEPIFTAQDLINLNNQHFVISMSIDGEKVPPFTAKSLLVPASEADYSNHIIENSRSVYSTPRAVVEEKISRWSNFENNGSSGGFKPDNRQHNNRGGNRGGTPVNNRQKRPKSTPVKSGVGELKAGQDHKLR